MSNGSTRAPFASMKALLTLREYLCITLAQAHGQTGMICSSLASTAITQRSSTARLDSTSWMHWQQESTMTSAPSAAMLQQQQQHRLLHHRVCHLHRALLSAADGSSYPSSKLQESACSTCFIVVQVYFVSRSTGREAGAQSLARCIACAMMPCMCKISKL